MKKIGISDFLEVEEVVEAIRLFRDSSDSTFAEKCDAQIIAPQIERINAKLGQEHHPRFLAYVVQHTFIKLNVKNRTANIKQKEYHYERSNKSSRSKRSHGFHGFSLN
jgi:hypothetical protein